VTSCHLERAAVEAFLDRSYGGDAGRDAADGGGACPYAPVNAQKLVCEQTVTSGQWREGCPQT
jgi:hypothetical protein